MQRFLCCKCPSQNGHCYLVYWESFFFFMEVDLSNPHSREAYFGGACSTCFDMDIPQFDYAFIYWGEWQPTPVFLPGESRDGGAWWAAVRGSHRHDWSDLAAEAFIERTDSETEVPILWPLDAKNRLIWKDWCLERLKAGWKGDDRWWDDWMASPTQSMWVWVNSRSWWWTGKPVMLQSKGSQIIGHDWATELIWTELSH